MSVVMPVFRAVVRDELSGRQPLALAAVTAVETNADGQGAHNVEVNAQLHGSDLELQRVPVACGRIGLSAAPRDGDTVVVAFVGGDLNGPVAIASLHDDQRHPPKAGPDEVVYEVPDDAAGVRRVEVITASGNTVTINDDSVKIVMGGTTIEVVADGAVAIESATDITLKASGDVTIEAGGNLDLKASKNATVKGDVNATLEASSQATLKGSTTSVKGQTSFGM
jgi:phage gp45-like